MAGVPAVEEGDSSWEIKKKELSDEILVLSESMSGFQTPLKDLNDKKASIEQLVENSVEITSMKNDIHSIGLEIQALETSEKERKSAFLKEKNLIDDNTSKITNTIWSMKQEIAKRPSLMKEKEELLKAICPTCKQEWQDSKREDRVSSIDEALLKIEKFEQNLPSLESTLTKLKSKSPTWEENPKLNGLKTNLSILQSELSKEKSSRKKLELSETLGAIQVLESKKMQVSENLSAKKRELAFLEERTQKEKALLESVRKMKQDLSKQNETVSSQLEEVQKNKDLLDNVLACVGKNGFSGSIFDQILQEIETETNELLGAMKNVSNISLRFTTETVTGKGTVKKTITPVLTVNGFEADYQTGISGGQQSSLELATDMALLNVVEKRTGKRAGILLQDEVLVGQGVETSSNSMEILKRVSEDKLVLVIDHASEVKEFFSQTIDVKNVDGASHI